MAATLFIVSAPSGAGKTSLVRAAVEQLERLTVSISHTTRPRRSGETDGVDYHFIDPATFEGMIAEGLFLEYAKVFDHWYGTSRSWVEERLDSGDDVVLEIDWQGAQKIRDRVAAMIGIFILPPSIDDLRIRLEKRAREGRDAIKRRLEEAISEMRHYDEYDCLVVNDDFDRAVLDLVKVVSGTRSGNKPKRRLPPARLLQLL